MAFDNMQSRMTRQWIAGHFWMRDRPLGSSSVLSQPRGMRDAALELGISIVCVGLAWGNAQILPVPASKRFGKVDHLTHVIGDVGEGTMQRLMHHQRLSPNRDGRLEVLVRQAA